MHFRKLGRTGLKVSALCLGTMQWGWTTDEPNAFAVMDAFVEAGGNFIDTADIYSKWAEGNPGGVSEEIIGKWMKARNNRNQIILATKLRGAMGNAPNDEGLSRKHIYDAVEASLRRLQTDYIDLYQAHSPDNDTDIGETLQALDDLVKAGKVRYIGASNYSAWQLVESLWRADSQHTARYDSLQPRYNLVHRVEFEKELKIVCEKYQVGVIPYSPLAAGFLTGKYSQDSSTDSKRAGGVNSQYATPTGWRILEVVRAVAAESNSTPTAVALAWLLAQPVISSPIIGANNPEQLKDSLAAPTLSLAPEQLERLSQVS